MDLRPSNPKSGRRENPSPTGLPGRQLSLLGPLAIAALLLACPLARAQFLAPEGLTTRSHSGQFILASSREPSPATPLLETNRECVRLSPVLLPVACERIKQEVWRELGAAGAWRGKIFLSLYPARSAGDEVVIRSELFQDGWQYRVELPHVVNRERYVRAIVQVVLLELANRNARERAAEIPLWLVEGLARELIASNEAAIILASPAPAGNAVGFAATQINTKKRGSLDSARKTLSLRTPLTFEQLSWPDAGAWEGETGDVFQASAHLFVAELLRLKGGRAALLAMVDSLPRFYNWQFAFLEAFRAWFQGPLDVEKWWTLRLVQATGRDLGEPLALGDSRVKLDEVIRHPIKVRIGTNMVPFGAEASLQTIIRDWSRDQQTVALEAKLRELASARPRVAPEVAPLVDEYREVIATFLKERDPEGFTLPFRKKALRRQAANTAIVRLDALDRQRLRLGQTDVDTR